MTAPFSLEDVLQAAATRGASEVHLKVPSPPLLRVHGRLERLTSFAGLRPAETEEVLGDLLASLPHSAKQHEFDRTGEVAFAYAHPELGRFRISAYRQRGSVSIVVRLVPFGVPRFDELGLPAGARSLVAHGDGLVLVTGGVKSGVTSTLAALVDVMNDTSERSIVTIEDPIELLHSDRRCSINQREVGLDTPSVAEALARVLGHDPDVVMVGTLPDLASTEAAIGLADAGILVLAAITSQGAGDAVERIVRRHPESRQGHARATLASSLRGVVAQQLVPSADGTDGRQLVVELMLGTPTVRRAIAEGADAARLAALIDDDPASGMVPFELALAQLVHERRITLEVARRATRNPVRLGTILPDPPA